MVGARSTRQKRAIAAVLAASEGFRSVQDIHAQLRAGGERVGLTTVYNQLRALAAAGDVDVLRNEDGENLYRRCASDSHHHHLLCRICGATVEIDSHQLETLTENLAVEAGFSDVTHTVEIVGTCPRH